jgi:NhaP-type Na+/H+ and K+/H+ antiporter
VAEIETASELVAHVLKEYGVSSRTVFEYTSKVRTQLNSVAESVSGSRYADLDLPSWEVLSSMRPVGLKPGDFAVGKSLESLELPKLAKVAVATVYRHGQGTFVPDGSVVLAEDDIIHLIGQTADLAYAEAYLARGIIL